MPSTDRCLTDELPILTFVYIPLTSSARDPIKILKS